MRAIDMLNTHTSLVCHSDNATVMNKLMPRPLILSRLSLVTNSKMMTCYKHIGNYSVIVETIFFIQNLEFTEKITQKFH